MKQWIWRLILPIAIAIATLPAAGPLRAEDVSLDDPGTYLLEVSSGRTVKLGPRAQVAWSPDSKTVAVVDVGLESPMPRLRLQPVPVGPARNVNIAEQGEINHLRWAPNGTRLAFTFTRTGRDPGPALMVADPSNGT